MKQVNKKTLLYKGGMVLLDILSVNAAYWLALIMRFFIGFEFRAGAEVYVGILARICPFYTVASIVIFAAFKLYNTLWKVAGIRDLNRLIFANLATVVVFVAVSVLTNNRMPLTIYFIGPVLQVAFTGAIRFGIKLVLMERDVRRKGSATTNAMVVGIRHLGRNARRQLDQNDSMATKCVVDTQNAEKGRLLNGVPVIGGVEGIRDAIEQYKINYVLIADSFLSDEQRKAIQEICAEKKIDVTDMTGFVENGSDSLSLVGLLKAVQGPVTLVVDGQAQEYPNGEMAMLSITKHYVVKSVNTNGKGICIKVTDNPLIPNDTSEAWAREYKEETGNDVSFF